MKKLFFILVLGIIALNLTSCLPTGANREEGTFPAVVSYNPKEEVTSLLTVVGELAAPGLATSGLRKGDCIIANFTLDWDNQPEDASIYYASNITHLFVEQDYAMVQSDFDEAEVILPDTYLLPIESLSPLAYHPILEGKFFFYFLHRASQQQTVNYMAIVKPNGEDSANEPVDIYVIAEKLNNPGTSDMTFENFFAFDMDSVIRELGKEDTYEAGSTVEYSVKELKVRIKYCTGFDNNDNPVYELYQYNGDSIITLSVYI